MDEPLAVALKFGFLAVLYLFLLWVARSAMKDLAARSAPARRRPSRSSRPSPRRRESVAARPARRRGPAAARWWPRWATSPGRNFDVGDGATMGRSDSAEIRVDDPFASSAHARIFPRGDFMYLEDMGSTNGTYLNGRQVKAAERLKVADVIRIGDSEYRYEE